ncbi:endolytic transglycosylase MltG [Nesterenkonia populi]|uniref:endolytic transglycosylase MltG n=1 Tax=Nesterenkonia populi TaxID=1591087 RepID=UPI0011BF24FD|nr:endolytic transglycosylase MltG [Nesterenkonia populi]
MSDEQPPEAGSRRRRREIREARERERAAERERESAVRRLSTSTTASEAQAPALFDQEELERRRRRGESVTGASGRVPQQSAASSASSADAAGAASRRARREQQEEERQAALEKRRAEQERAERAAAERAAAPRDSGFYAGAGLDAGWEGGSPAPQPKPSSSEPQQPTRQARAAQSAPSSPQPRSPEARDEPQQTSSAQDEPIQDPDRTRAIPTAAPSTPFDDVVAGSPSDADQNHELPEEGHFDGQEFHELEGFEGLDWEDFEGGQIEHDASGSPVLVAASDFGRGYQTVQPMEGRMSLDALKAKKAKQRRRNVTLVLFLAVFAAMVIGVVTVVRSFLGGGEDITDYDQASGETIEFEVREGEGFETVANRLVEQEIVASWGALSSAYQAADAEGDMGTLQPGEYPMQEQMPAGDAIEALYAEGPEQFVVGIAPGIWIEDALDEIAERTPHSREEIAAAAEDPQAYDLPDEAETLEGYLAPGEYSWDVEDEVSPEEILQDMVDETFSRFEELGLEDEEEQWETVIIASLITAEANHANPDDYDLMSSAIQNRLVPDNPETDGYLYIDATSNYALGEHDLHIAAEHDADDEYNTRTNPGLPPGPIGAPTTATLEAAIDPPDTDYHYWVTVNIETGETEFAENLAQHEQYEQEFLDYCSENPDVCSPGEVDAAEEELGL